MDLDPDKVTNSLQDAVIQSEIFKKFQEQMPQQQQAPQPPGEQHLQELMFKIPQEVGDQIGTVQHLQPGEEGFTGNV